MNANFVKPQTRKIWDLSLEGKSAPQIAKELNLKFALVNSAVRRGREKGVIPWKRNVNPHAYIRGVNLRLGTISAVISQLTMDQVVWLASEANKVGVETLSEFIMELVRDAHAVDNS
tara:strand:- start:879 stop:1229 length:351 start_codon:yes stop_codon:yes gene_type:complete